jgi:hypothetical protein
MYILEVEWKGQSDKWDPLQFFLLSWEYGQCLATECGLTLSFRLRCRKWKTINSATQSIVTKYTNQTK